MYPRGFTTDSQEQDSEEILVPAVRELPLLEGSKATMGNSVEQALVNSNTNLRVSHSNEPSATGNANDPSVLQNKFSHKGGPS